MASNGESGTRRPGRGAAGKPAHRLIGGVDVVAAPRQICECSGARGIVVGGFATALEQVDRAVELGLGVACRDRRLDQLRVEAAAGERLANPLRSPAAQLALVLGEPAGEALVVERPVLDQALERSGNP